MKRFFIAVRILSLGLILAAALLAYREWVRFSQQWPVLPPGSLVAGVPVGGLDRQAAARRLQEAYALPVEMRYAGAVIHLDPAAAGFELDLDAMLPDWEPAPSLRLLWSLYWDFLWDRPQPSLETELHFTFSRDRLRQFLEQELAPRYDRPSTAALPVAGAVDFRPGASGFALDVDGSLPRIEAALLSLEHRQVELLLQPLDPSPPSLKNLHIQLQQLLALSGFDGLAEVYLLDLRSSRSLHFAYRRGETIQPGVAFTASSIIKIPILVSVYSRLEVAPDETTAALMQEMIANSSNDAADALMKRVLDEVRGPLLVSEDLRRLGLENTFLAGYFALGSPLLQIFETPANLRRDVATEPDLYNQTTPDETGFLLGEIYRCAASGSGVLLETFPGQITQAECQGMIEFLKGDRQPYLVTAGLPEGTPIAHKHGYGSANDIINTIGDAGIIYSPGGDYVLVVFLNNPELLLWDPSNVLVARLSRAVYNFFNLQLGETAASLRLEQ